MNKLLHGVGLTHSDRYKRTEIGLDGKRARTKEYRLWCHMLDRCYWDYCQARQPTYKGCLVSENFKSFDFFAEWCQTQIGFKSDNYHLDKDILGTGKLYSEDCCVFIPARINSLMLSPKSKKSDLPKGVYFCKRNRKYKAQIRIMSIGSQIGLGYFDSVDEAVKVYNLEKEKIVKSVAEEYKDIIDPRVYKFLSQYTIPDKL